MTTLKSVISNGISDTLTAIYTNTSGQDAALKAFNVNTPGSGVVASTGASEWTFLGDTYTYGDSGEQKQGVPYFIQLTDNRVLALFTNTGKGAGNTSPQNTIETPRIVYAQIIERQSTKYMAGRITRLIFPANLETSSPFHGNPFSLTNGIAVTPTKVVLTQKGVSNDTFLININITGDSVSPTIYSLQLNGGAGFTFGNATGMMLNVAPVVDNTNKVIVAGLNNLNQYTLAAFNVTGSATPTIAGSAFNTGITSDNQTRPSYIALHRRSDNTYISAVYTSTSALSAGIFTFTESTNTFTNINTAALSVATASVSSSDPVLIGCVSNGTDYNSVIAARNRTTAGRYILWRQTSGTAVSTSPYTQNGFSSGSTTDKTLSIVNNWGNQRAVFSGKYNYIFGWDSAGNDPTISTTVNNSTAYSTAVWVPFNSRPLYFTNGNMSGGTWQLIAARINPSSATDFGTESQTGNYLPLGFPTGKHYIWNHVCNCWTVALGTVIYNLSNTGEILSETFTQSTGAGGVSIKNIAVTDTGRIIGAGDRLGAGGGSADVTSEWNSSQGNIFYCTATVTTPTGLNGLSSANFGFTRPNNALIFIDLIYYNAGTTEKVLALYVNLQTTTRTLFGYDANVTSSGFASASTNGISNHSGTTNGCYGRPRLAIVPTSAGNCMLVGENGFGYNSSMQMISTTNSVTNNQIASGSVTLTWTGLVSDTPSNLAMVFPTSVATYPGGMRVVTMSYGTTSSTATHKNYTWVSNNQVLLSSTAGTQTNSINLLCPIASATKALAAVTLNSGVASNTANTNPVALLFNTSTTMPYASYTGTAGIGYLQNYPATKYSIGIDGDSLDYIFISTGTDSVKFYMALNNGTSDFYITPISGQTLSATNNRATDVYYVPNGGSIKVRGELANIFDVLLTVLEQ